MLKPFIVFLIVWVLMSFVGVQPINMLKRHGTVTHKEHFYFEVIQITNINY